MEILPEIELGDFSELEVTRLKAEVQDEAVEQALGRLAEDDKVFEAVEPARPAAEGDQLLVDIAVEVDGVPAPERGGTDLPLELDTEALVPEMTEQLVGAQAGEEREVTLTPRLRTRKRAAKVKTGTRRRQPMAPPCSSSRSRRCASACPWRWTKPSPNAAAPRASTRCAA